MLVKRIRLPALNDKLKSCDWVTAINGQKVNQRDAIRIMYELRKAGGTVRFV